MPHAMLLAEDDNEFFCRRLKFNGFQAFHLNNEGFDPWQSSLAAPF